MYAPKTALIPVASLWMLADSNGLPSENLIELVSLDVAPVEEYLMSSLGPESAAAP